MSHSELSPELRALDSQVLVVGATPGNLRRATALLSASGQSWAYLGDSVAQHHHLEQRLESIGSQIATTQMFHNATNDLREAYLTYIYDMGREVNSLRWWLSSISFRSCYSSKTFYLACWLKVALDLIDSWHGPGAMVLFVPNDLLRRIIHSNRIGLSGREGKSDSIRRVFKFRPAVNLMKILVRRTFFVLREGLRLSLARRYGPSRHLFNEPTTLVISSVSYRSVHLAEEYHTYFFGDLVRQLSNLGTRVALVPIVLKGVDYKKALSGLRGSLVPVMVPHQYLRFIDLLKAAFSTVGRPPVPRSVPNFAGMDISLLVKEEMRDYEVTNWAADSLLIWALVRRWSDMCFPVDRMIYIYENQPWERALCAGARKFLPDTALVGYQHARTPKLLLSFYLAPGGESEAPLPHRVITVGAHTAELLGSSGYEPGQVRVGGALQIRALTPHSEVYETDPDNGGIDDGNQSTVLIACSNGIQESAELAHLATSLFPKESNTRLMIKFHPGMPLRQVSKFMQVVLPSHVEISEEPLEQLMARSSLMVYSGSTVCLEALAIGLPVIHFRPKFDLDMDPLGAAPEARLEATGSDELRETICWLLENRAEYITEHQIIWRQLVDEMYGPISQETYAAFVDTV